MEFVLAVLVSGLVSGAYYALLAIAIVLIFRTTGVANFAQGELAMLCAFIFAMAVAKISVPVSLQWLFTLIVSAALSGAIYLLLLRPRDDADRLNLMIRTLGVYTLAHAVALYLWGANEPYSVTSIFPQKSLAVGGYRMTYDQFGALAAAAAIAGLLFGIFRFTPLGLAMRAVALDAQIATLRGINVRRISLFVWMISGAIGGLLGLLIAPVSFLESNMMQPYILKAFTAAILGGINSFPGAVAGALILGVIESVSGAWLSIHLREPFVFAVLLLTLLLKPEGLFSRSHRGRV